MKRGKNRVAFYMCSKYRANHAGVWSFAELLIKVHLRVLQCEVRKWVYFVGARTGDCCSWDKPSVSYVWNLLAKMPFSVPFAAVSSLCFSSRRGTDINLSNIYLSKQRLWQRFIDCVISSEAENTEAQEQPRKGLSQPPEAGTCLFASAL